MSVSAIGPSAAVAYMGNRTATANAMTRQASGMGELEIGAIADKGRRAFINKAGQTLHSAAAQQQQVAKISGQTGATGSSGGKGIDVMA